MEAELPRAEEIVARAREEGSRDRVPLTGPHRDALRRAVAELAADLTDSTPGAVATQAARDEARSLLAGAEQLLARVHAALPGTSEETEWLAALSIATEQLVVSAVAVARGLPDATAILDRARATAADATRTLPGWALGKGEDGRVFDKNSGSSRYDARQEEVASYRLTCPEQGCHRDHLYGWTARHSTHRFSCAHCNRPFTAYLGEVRRLSVEASGVVAHYVLRCADLDGTPRTFEFVDASGASFGAAPGDYVVLIYSADGGLRAVQDLASGRHLWLTAKSSCFVATVVYGEGAPELEVLRRFRDRRLVRTAAGRLFARAYYRHGALLAEALNGRPGATAAVRGALDRLVRLLADGASR